MAVNILTPMPPRAGRRGRDVELVELRVLDGPNRFFTRPAVKLEFAGTQPGDAAHVAEAAGRAVQRLSVELGLPEPRLARRESVDGLRSAIAYPWRRRTISQSIGASASRLALGRSSTKREIAGLRATALGPLSHLPRPRIPIVAVTGTNGKSTTTRLIAHVCATAGRQVGMTNSDGIYVRGELVEAGDWTGFGGAARILVGARARRRDPRDRSRRHPAARDRLRVERRQRRHERQRRPSRPAGDRHRRRAGGREVDGRPDHEARRLGRPQRRRPSRVGHAPGNPGEGLRLQPRGPDRRGSPGAALRRPGRDAREGLDRAPRGHEAPAAAARGGRPAGDVRRALASTTSRMPWQAPPPATRSA